jgi:hypothetical protein
MRVAGLGLAALVLASLATEAPGVAVRVRWEASPDPSVTGYNVYVRERAESYATPRDAGLPAPADDGSLGFLVDDLDATSVYVFAVSAYAPNAESPLSNELTVVQSCRSDADCADDDACTANERCRNGRCQRDHLACTQAPCNEALCHPDRGCVVTAAPDGTTCDDADPCEPGVCSAGACTLPESALSRLGAHHMTVSRFALQPAGQRRRVLGTASFAASSGFDPSVTGAAVELRGGDGTVLYAAAAPAAAFRASKGGRAFRYLPKRGRAAGLRRLLLAFDGSIADVSLQALTGAFEDPGSVRGSLAWAVRVGDLCVRDPRLACKRTSGKSLSCS